MVDLKKKIIQKELSSVKNYWNSRPCNIRHSNKDVGTLEYFNEIEFRKYFVEPHIPVFAEFERWKGKKVLEIGCGIGTDTINFARAGATVIAVDLSEESLKLARKRAEIFKLTDKITFIAANAEKLSDYVPIGRYDLIYSFGVIHHTPNPQAVIEQIKKYMDKDSVFKIMVYNKLSYKVLWILLKYGKGKFWNIDELIAEYSEAQTGCPVTYSYTKNSIKNYLLSDFNIQKLFVEHIFPYSIPEYVSYQYKKVWYFEILPEKIFRILEKNFGWHLCAESRLDVIKIEVR